MKTLAPALKLLLVGGLFASATNILAQSKPAPQFKPNPSLSDQEKRGEYFFVQRCALCHLSHYSKADPAAYPPLGPSLQGVFKGASPEKEKFLRDYILKGSQKMPGFQYGLEPKDIDDLIAYLKTL